MGLFLEGVADFVVDCLLQFVEDELLDVKLMVAVVGIDLWLVSLPQIDRAKEEPEYKVSFSSWIVELFAG